MATIELAQLTDHLDETQLKAMNVAVAEETSEPPDLSSDEDGIIVDGNIDDDLFVDFRDRLEANDSDADVYIPVEFEDVIKIADLRIGSTYALQAALDGLRDDFFVEDLTDSETEVDEGDDDFERGEETDEAARYYDDEDGGIEMKDEQLRHIWRLMHRAASESLTANLAVFLLD